MDLLTLYCHYTRPDGSTEDVIYANVTINDADRWSRALLSQAALHGLSLELTATDQHGVVAIEGRCS